MEPRLTAIEDRGGIGIQAIDEDEFNSVAKYVEYVESSGNPDAVSARGAAGLMGIMPNTGMNPGYGVDPIAPRHLVDPKENLRFGRDYLSAMVNRYGNVEHALAAYNWGAGNVDRWLRRGARRSQLPKDTQDYIAGWSGIGKHAMPKGWKSWEEQ